MRLAILIMVVIFFPWDSIAQHIKTKKETVKWLREKLAQNDSIYGRQSNRLNFTKMCVNVNFLPEEETATAAKIDKYFKDKIVSDVSWGTQDIKVHNDIFINGKLRETYTYKIPLTAIVGASITNCKRNTSGNVNAYVDRPIFIAVKKNTTRIGHVSYDKRGKAAGNKARQYYMNNTDADWDSSIPIAGNWDKNAGLQDKIVKAFARLAELNGKGYTSR